MKKLIIIAVVLIACWYFFIHEAQAKPGEVGYKAPVPGDSLFNKLFGTKTGGQTVTGTNTAAEISNFQANILNAQDSVRAGTSTIEGSSSLGQFLLSVPPATTPAQFAAAADAYARGTVQAPGTVAAVFINGVSTPTSSLTAAQIKTLNAIAAMDLAARGGHY